MVFFGFTDSARTYYHGVQKCWESSIVATETWKTLRAAAPILIWIPECVVLLALAVLSWIGLKGATTHVPFATTSDRELGAAMRWKTNRILSMIFTHCHCSVMMHNSKRKTLNCSCRARRCFTQKAKQEICVSAAVPWCAFELRWENLERYCAADNFPVFGCEIPADCIKEQADRICRKLLLPNSEHLPFSGDSFQLSA